MHATPFERVKNIVTRIKALEDKLMNTNFMPLPEQKKVHEEIKRLREEMAILEKRTRTK